MRSALLSSVFVLVFLSTLAQPAAAKLAQVTLDQLIERSELIMQALPMWTQRAEEKRHNTRGRAELIPFGPAVKGEPKKLRLTWTGDVHDQAIEDLGPRVLFLRKTRDGKWGATAVGRSYLSVSHEAVRTASLPKAMQTNAVANPDKDMQHVELIFVDEHPAATIVWPDNLVLEVDVYRPRGQQRFEKRRVVPVSGLWVYLQMKTAG